MSNLHTRLKIDKLRRRYDILTISVYEIPDVVCRIKIDNTKNTMDELRSISLGEIDLLLNGEILSNFELLTRLVVDNSQHSANKGLTILTTEILEIINYSPDDDGESSNNLTLGVDLLKLVTDQLVLGA